MGSFQNEYTGSITSNMNTNVKALYVPRPDGEVCRYPTTSSSSSAGFRIERNVNSREPPIGQAYSVSTLTTNTDMRPETAPPGYERITFKGSKKSTWGGRKSIIIILLLNTVLMLGIAAIAITSLLTFTYEIKELKRIDQVRTQSIINLELLVSDLKMDNTPIKKLNTTETPEKHEGEKDIEIERLLDELKKLSEANKTCNDALRNTNIPTVPTTICPDEFEINNLKNRVQDLFEANKTCYKALESQKNTENCSSTHQDEIRNLKEEVQILSEANKTCSKALESQRNMKNCSSANQDEDEISNLKDQVQILSEANKTCSKALESQRNMKNCSSANQDKDEISSLKNRVQILSEANKTCAEALEKQQNTENCPATRQEIEMLEEKIGDLREANTTCSIELKTLKDDIPPCLVTTPTIDPNAIDIYNWVEAPNGLEYWISWDVNFFEANTTCISKRAQMISSTIRDDLAIREFLAYYLIGPRRVDVWIGLTDLEEEGVWLWQDGVLATLFNTNWYGSEPDGSGNCALLSSSQFMRDYWCFSNKRALCEREPNTSAADKK